MRTAELGQNFLRNQRTARKLVKMAGGTPDMPCVDLGAGKGIITTSALLRGGPVIAIETDPRLARGLRTTFADEPLVEVRSEDLMESVIPTRPFVIAANPPFNLSTRLVRRWMTAPTFVSGALIVQRPFGGRISGEYGATKLSLSLAPLLDLAVPVAVRAAEFNPQPRVATAILTAVRRNDPDISASDHAGYWRFINYLFERSSLTVGQALATLRLRLNHLKQLRVRELTPSAAVQIYTTSVRDNRAAEEKIATFERRLPEKRRSDLAAQAQLARRSPRQTPSRTSRATKHDRRR